MASFTDSVNNFFDDHGEVLTNFFIWFFLAIAIMHAFSYATTYLITLFNNVIRRGEKSQESWWKTRMVALGFFFFYLIYNLIVYSLLVQIINWKQAFYGRPWARSIYDYPYTDALR